MSTVLASHNLYITFFFLSLFFILYQALCCHVQHQWQVQRLQRIARVSCLGRLSLVVQGFKGRYGMQEVGCCSGAKIQTVQQYPALEGRGPFPSDLSPQTWADQPSMQQPAGASHLYCCVLPVKHAHEYHPSQMCHSGKNASCKSTYVCIVMLNLIRIRASFRFAIVLL